MEAQVSLTVAFICIFFGLLVSLNKHNSLRICVFPGYADCAHIYLYTLLSKTLKCRQVMFTTDLILFINCQTPL